MDWLPLWNGEWGYSTYDPDAPATGLNYLPAVSPARQASYLVRTLLTAQHLGLAGSVWFKDRDAPTPDPGDIEQHFGLMRDDLGSKPAYEALSTLTRLVGDGTSGGELPLPPGEHGVIFETAAGRIVTLWAETPATWTLTAATPAGRVLARNGRDMTPPGLTQGVSLSLEPDDGPIYLVGEVSVQ